MVDDDVLELALAARAMAKQGRQHGTPLSHEVKWMAPPPELVEPETTWLYQAVRVRARQARLNPESAPAAEAIGSSSRFSRREARHRSHESG
jgi:hypothetical protein